MEHPPQYEVLRHLVDGRFMSSKILKPVQDGGTWCSQIVPTLWLLFEERDPVVFGGPDMQLLGRLWKQKIRTAIESSPWRDQITETGKGSRGGIPDEITFANGVTLTFIGAGAKNEAGQAGVTARGVFTDEYDSIDPYRRRLIKARSRFFQAMAVCSDCSTLKEYSGDSLLEKEYNTISSGARLAYRCPHTGWYRLLEWDGSDCWVEYDDSSDRSARESACLVFDHFGELIRWTEQDRQQAMRDWLLVHRGQWVMHCIDGNGYATTARICGPEPETDCFGLRWTALDSPKRDLRDLAKRHREAIMMEQTGDDTAIASFTRDELVRSYQRSTGAEDDGLVPAVLSRRTIGYGRRVVPDDTIAITIGADPGGARTGVHWAACAWRPQRRGHIIDYGRFAPVATDPDALLAALAAWYADIVQPGWQGRLHDMLVVDANWLPEAVNRFCAQYGFGRHKPIQGYSQTNPQFRNYRPRTTRDRDIIRHDRNRQRPTWHEQRTQHRGALLQLDSDFWKRQVHAALRLPSTHPGAMTLHDVPDHGEHLRTIPIEHAREVPGIAVQLCGEHQVYDEKKGAWIWTPNREVTRESHWLDAVAYATAAADYIGLFILPDHPDTSTMREQTKPVRAINPVGLTMPDGRPFLATQR